MSKKTIASTLIELLKKYPYQKITVKMICENTPVCPNGFYYYFKNKEEIVKWICLTDFQKYCLPYFSISADNISAKSFFECILKNKLFYQRIYEYDKGNLLHTCLMYAYSSASTLESVKEYGHPREGTHKRINRDVYLSYSNSGIASVIILWISQDMMPSLEMVARDLRIMLTHSLEEIRDNYLY